ncbi:MAG TPA: phosphatase PAP2 family protein [Dongiaceae bacterium]|nr:phosphatase PAP2 family protein [Dongiaceae bacterium]
MIRGLGLLARPLALAVLVSGIATLDLDVRDAVQRARNPALEPVMRAVTNVTQPRNVFALMVGVAVFGGPAGPVLVREATAALLPVNLVVEVLKRTVDRTRPDGSRDPNNASFPSSHAANACAIAVLVTRRWPRAGWIAWPLALLVCVSRMWLDRHYLTDVLAAAVIGAGIAWWVTRWARNAGRGWVESGRYPGGR